MRSTSARGQIAPTFSFSEVVERLSIDWEDGLPSYSQKKSQVNICWKRIDPDSPQDFAAGCHSYERQWKNTAEWQKLLINEQNKPPGLELARLRASHTAEYANNILPKKETIDGGCKNYTAAWIHHLSRSFGRCPLSISLIDWCIFGLWIPCFHWYVLATCSTVSLIQDSKWHHSSNIARCLFSLFQTCV